MRIAISAVAFAVIALLGVSTRAQDAGVEPARDVSEPSAADRARARFEAGRRAIDEARYADAVVLFREAHALAPNVSTAFNLALALAHVGDTLEAIALFEALLAAEHGELRPEQGEDVRRRIDAAREELATLHISVSGAPRAIVSVDGEQLAEVIAGGAALAVRVDPGDHEVVARAAAGDGRVVDRVHVGRGEELRVRLALPLAAPRVADEATSTPAPPPRAEPRDDASSGATWLWIGVAALAVGAGALAAVLLLSDEAESDAPLARVTTLRW